MARMAKAVNNICLSVVRDKHMPQLRKEACISVPDGIKLGGPQSFEPPIELRTEHRYARGLGLHNHLRFPSRHLTRCLTGCRPAVDLRGASASCSYPQ